MTNDIKPKNRLNPIKETITTIHGYPSRLVIYKLAASRFFWCRYYYQNRYFIKSTKTESPKDAKVFAIKFYESVMLSAINNNTNDHSKAFSAIALTYFKTTEKNTDRIAYKSNFSRYKLHLLPFFKDQSIDTITNSQLSELVSRLQDAKLQPATIKHYLVVLRTIFKYAIANNVMQSLPLFPKINGKLRTSQKRDYFTQEEYEEIVRCTERLAKQDIRVRGIPITLEMKYLIQFMVNSFLRPSDLRVLKHKHIVKMKDDSSEWLALRHPATKTNANEVQAMPASVHIYDRLMQLRKDTHQKTSLDDYVFFPQYENRITAMGVMSRLFSRIVEESDLKRKTDKYLTLYSLRHTSIMLRIIIGKVDTLALARNARTSQAMIDNFYAAHLTTNQVRKQLHAFPVVESKNIKGKATKKPSTSVTLDLAAEPTKTQSKRKSATVDSVSAAKQKKLGKAATPKP
jgi:integrase